MTSNDETMGGWLERAKHWEREGDGARVEASLRAGIAFDEPDCANELGLLLRDQGRFTESEKVLQAAAASGDDAARLNLGNLLADHLGRPGEGKEQLARAALGGSELALVNLGILCQALGEAAAATRLLDTAVELEVDGALRARGQLHETLGESAQAEDMFRQAITAGDGRAHAHLAALLAESGRSSEAERHYRQGIEAGDEQCYSYLAWLLSERRGFDDAREVFEEAVAANAQEAKLQYGLFLADHEGHESTADVMLRSALDEGCPSAWIGLGELHRRRMEFEDAIAAFNAAASQGLVDGYVCVARTLLEWGKTAAATSWLADGAARGDSDAVRELAEFAPDASTGARAVLDALLGSSDQNGNP